MLTTGTVPSGQTCSVMRAGRASLGAALSVTAGIGTSLLKLDLSFVGLSFISRFIRHSPAARHVSQVVTLDGAVTRYRVAGRISEHQTRRLTKNPQNGGKSDSSLPRPGAGARHVLLVRENSCDMHGLNRCLETNLPRSMGGTSLSLFINRLDYNSPSGSRFRIGVSGSPAGLRETLTWRG